MISALQKDVYKESEIIAQVKAGNIDAFCKLVDEYKRKTLSIAYSFCFNYEDAKDLSQEAFIKAFKAIRKFKGQSKFYTWLYRILINICRDFLRRKKSNKFTIFSLKFRNKDGAIEQEDIFEYIASDIPGPGEALENNELGERLTAAISTLPKMQRIVFTLKNIQHLTITEIAEIIQRAPGTVKAHLFKAAINLQAELEEYINEECLNGIAGISRSKISFSGTPQNTGNSAASASGDKPH